MSVISELRMQPTRTTRLSWNAGLTARLVLTVSVSFLLLVGANLATPLYPQMQQSLHLGPMGTTVAFSSYVGALMFFLLVLGHWSDHIGRRAALVLAVGVTIAGTLLFGQANSLATLCLARGVQGLGVALATGACAAALRELLPQRPEWASRLTLLGTSAGVALGPVIGGALAEATGERSTVFAIQGALLLVLLIPLTLLQARPAIEMAAPGHRTRVLAPRKVSIPAHARNRFIIASLVGFLSFAVFGFVLSLAPGYLADEFGIRALWGIGLLAGLPLGTSALTQALVPSTDKSLSIGLVLLGAGTVGFAYFSSQAVFAASVLSLAVLGIGQALAFRASFSDCVDSIEPQHHAQIVSGVYLITYLGSAVPVIALGWAVSRFGQAPSIMVFSVICAVLSAALLAMAAWMRKRV